MVKPDPLPPPQRPRSGPPEPLLCDICESAMYEHNCKIVCGVCGYKRDCTDP